MKAYTLHEICEALELVTDKSVAEKYKANALTPSGLRFAWGSKSDRGTVFRAESLSRAYSRGFDFHNSPEGWDFWNDIWDELDSWDESEIWETLATQGTRKESWTMDQVIDLIYEQIPPSEMGELIRRLQDPQISSEKPDLE